MTDKGSSLKLQELFFGKEALIIKARRKELLENHIIDSRDIKKCLMSLNDPSEALEDPIQKLNVFSCLLYYQCVCFGESKKHFAFVERKLQPNCEINQTNLFLICNIIEFEDRYKPVSRDSSTSPAHQDLYETLLSNLSRFEKQVPQYNVLVSYYKALLYLLLRRVQECDAQIVKAKEEIRKLGKADSLNPAFLEILSSLLKIRLYKLKCFLNKESSSSFEKEIWILFSTLELKQPLLAFKLGNYLANYYLKKLDLEQCVGILQKLSMLIKNAKYKLSEKVARSLSITLIYKFIFCFSFQNKLPEYTAAIERLNEVIVSERQSHLKILYSFLYNSYTLDTDKNALQKEKLTDQVNTFKSCFLNLSKSSTFAEFFLPNFDIIYNNLFALSHTESAYESFKKRVASYIDKIQKGDESVLCGDHNDQYDIANIYIYIYNLISYYVNQYLSEQDATAKSKFKNQITNTIASLLSYINSFHKSMASLKTPLVMNLVITLYSIYLELIDNDSFDKVVDIYKKQFSGNLGVPSDYKGANGLIEKAIADNYFKQNKYQEALDRYKECLGLFGNVEEEYRTGTVRFNMGICYLMLNNKADAVTQLEQSLAVFTNLRDNLVSGIDVISKRCDAKFYETKIQHVNDVLEMLQ